MNILFILLQIILLDGILSIDNAAALAAIAETLPKNVPSPLPHSLLWLGKNQREAVLKVGIFGAYFGRGIMLLLAGIILLVPALKVVGALYLFYLVGTHFFGWYKWEPKFKGISNFWMTVILIEIADLAFSLDNVAAVIAISSNIFLVILGVFISILIMRFAAQLFMKLIEFEPLLEHAAFVLIFAIALELLLKAMGIIVNEVIQFLISMSILAVFVLYGQVRRRYALG